ncbi:MAG TPA: pitrilysin family protein [Blastocatellia bacterium]|nr:pitrilysin family protein [Blastocatellia bacterium]
MKPNVVNPIRNDQKFNVRKTRLENGLVVLTEQMPHLRSVSFGVFLRSGSRHETEARHGLTHFIEHALFKGTRRRSVAQIAAEGDMLGGNLDAFTGREIVGFYNNVLDEHLPHAFDLIADLVTSPAFDPHELKKERGVIMEEIKMVEDTPDDLIFDLFCSNFYPDHPLGRPILGTPKTLSGFKDGVVENYYKEIYCPNNLVIAAAGNVEHKQMVKLAKSYFKQLKFRQAKLVSSTPQPKAALRLRNKAELEQSHIVIGVPSPSLVSDDIYTANLLSVILGGGMSSRLFQRIREELGLAYTVFASINPFHDCGYLTIYAGTSTDCLDKTIEATMAELHKIKTEPISEEELQRNKEQLKASVRLSLESASSRMSALASNEMNFGRFISADEVISEIEAVTVKGLQALANKIFQPDKLAVTLLGNLKGFKLRRSQLAC